MVNDIAISVIIPLYDKGPYIKRTINSILQQTIQNFEVVVVDDQSHDDGPAIVKSIQDPRIILIEQDHRGVSATQNHGVEVARSDFIAILGADDEFSSPKHLETLIRLRKKFPDAGLYATTYKTMEMGNVIMTPIIRAIPPAPWEGLIPNYFQAAMYGMPFNACCVGISKRIFIEMGGFLPGIQWGEDEDLWLRIALKYRIAFSWDGEILWHREASNRIGNTLNLIAFEREPVVTQALTALKNNSVSTADIPFLKEFIAKFELTRALWNIKRGNAKEARKILRDCETILFKKRKIRLLLFAYIPSPVFVCVWKFIRTIKQYVGSRDYSHDPWLK
jgi:glycosyltransferase involved in cell wall biosynthesis